jgi:hypothetical protein
MLEGGGKTRGVTSGGRIWIGSDDRGLNRVKGGERGRSSAQRGVREEESRESRGMHAS